MVLKIGNRPIRHLQKCLYKGVCPKLSTNDNSCLKKIQHSIFKSQHSNLHCRAKKMCEMHINN